jgi:hypothetical protein
MPKHEVAGIGIGSDRTGTNPTGNAKELSTSLGIPERVDLEPIRETLHEPTENVMKTRSMHRLCRMGAGAVLLVAALVTATVQAAATPVTETVISADHGWGPVPPPRTGPTSAGV